MMRIRERKKHNSRNLVSWCVLFLILLWVSMTVTTGLVHAEIQIPKQSDWTDHGIAITEGSPGSWDVRFSGISPCTVVKKDGTYFLYYIGADGDRSTDGGPRHRALGVATSTDGINFTKYSGNPILTHLPHNNEEEGIFSGGATIDSDGNIILYYGALDANSPTSESVDSDIRLAVSSDGFNFTEIGDVVSHSDSSVWGYGDELFPVGTFQANGQWYVYYIAKGYGTYWDLGLAWGPSADDLPNTQAVLTSGSNIIGGCDPVRVASDKIAIFVVRDFSTLIVEIRTALTDSPETLSAPVVTYDFSDSSYMTIFIDWDTSTWFMYHSDPTEKTIRVKTISLGNQPPIAQDLSVTTAENTAKLITLVATDVDGDTLTYSIVTQPLHGTLSGAAPNMTYTPDANYIGSDSFTFKANDGTVDSNVEAVSITVTSVNDAPVAQDQSVTTDEDTARAITLVATDVDGDTLTYSIVTQPLHGTLSGAAPNVTYTPDTDYNGSDSFTFMANDGLLDSNVATVFITVGSELIISNLMVASGKSYEVVYSGLVVGAFQYIDRSYTFSEVPGSITGATYIKTANNDKNRAETDFLSFDVNQDVTIYVAHDDRIVPRPSWLHDFVDTGEDLLSDDLESEGFSLFKKDFPQGTISLGGNRDSSIPADTKRSMYTVVIVGTGSSTNHAPEAQDQLVTTTEDTARAITLVATDVDDDPLTYSIVTQPSHGTLSGTAPNVTYTPDANYNGSDSFTFKANDGTVDSNVATVSIAVTAPLIATASADPTSGEAPLTVQFTGKASGGAGGTGEFLEYGGMVVIEAEHFTNSDGRSDPNSVEWQVSSVTSGFVGEEYMETPLPQGTNAEWSDACEVSYAIKFSTAGTYSIWLRVQALDGAANSAYVGLDESQVGSTFDNDSSNYGVWKWEKHSATVSVTAGSHTFNLRRSEAGYKVDRIILTTDSGFIPAGDGPVESAQASAYTYSWNFDDGVGSSTEQNPVYTYDTPATYTAVLTVFDGVSQTTGSVEITVGTPNLPPFTPANPSPSDGATDVPIDAVLSWTGGDPDAEDTVTYDVYFGTNTSPPQVAGNQLETTYDPGMLDYSTEYYWRIVATDEHDASNESEVWSFTTTAVPAPETIPPLVSNPSANPDVIPDDTDNDPRWGETSQINVTVTDDSDVLSVTINLSAIGGSPTQSMTSIPDTNTWTVSTNASAGTAPGIYHLKINATDTNGNSNTSVSVELRVMKNGDIDGDGTVTLDDSEYLANYLTKIPGYGEIEEVVADVDEQVDECVTIADYEYLKNHISGEPGYEKLH